MICRYCGKVGPDVCDTPPVDICDHALHHEPFQQTYPCVIVTIPERPMTDPDTHAMQGLNFVATALIEIRDEEGLDTNIAGLVSQALENVQAAMILSCGRPSWEDKMAMQQKAQAAQQVMGQAQQTWADPNRG